eukprot:9283027-Pyramimonas_sp.AAC.2
MLLAETSAVVGRLLEYNDGRRKLVEHFLGAGTGDLGGLVRLLSLDDTADEVRADHKTPPGPVTCWGVNDRKNHKSYH